MLHVLDLLSNILGIYWANEKALTSSKIQAGFKYSKIWPWDPAMAKKIEALKKF